MLGSGHKKITRAEICRASKVFTALSQHSVPTLVSIYKNKATNHAL